MEQFPNIMIIQGLSGGWAKWEEWAIAYLYFGRLEGAALLLAHPALGSLLLHIPYFLK